MPRILFFSFNCLTQFFPCLKKNHLIFFQIKHITFQSLPLSLIVAVFTGAIIVIQSISQLGDFIPLQYVGIAVQKSLMIDLSPVLTAIIVTGKISGSITAEIGTMATSEQIDAMKINNLNPFKYLIVPRILGGIVSLPLITIFSTSIGILGSLLIVTVFYNLSPSAFVAGLRLFFDNRDVVVNLIKSVTFGFLITSFACYFGYYCQGGSEKVGKVSQVSVMSVNIAILFCSYLISFIFL